RRGSGLARDLGRALALAQVRLEHGPVAAGESAQRLLERALELAGEQSRLGALGSHGLEPRRIQRTRALQTPLVSVMDEDAEEPRREAARRVIAPAPLDGGQEGLLQEVVGLVRVAHEIDGHAQELGSRGVEDRSQGLHVALAAEALEQRIESAVAHGPTR